MSDKQYVVTVNHLDTEKMAEAVKVFDEQMQMYNSTKDDIKTAVDKLLKSWEGDAREAFEKDYLLLTKQLEDLHEVLMDLRKGLIDAEESYINADAEVSKSIAVDNSNR